MQTLAKILFVGLCLSLFTACASYKIKYDKSNKDWRANVLPNKPIDQQIFLIGDVGEGNDGDLGNLLEKMETQLKQANKKSTILFLGDNIASQSFPEIGNPERKFAENDLKKQLKPLKEFSGNIFFIPGNKDWESKDGVEGVRKFEKFIQKFLAKGNTFIPNKGCSGPEVKQLSETTVLIAIDSEWYLENWDNRLGVNEDCEFRTREQFLKRLSDKVKDNRQKNIIFALHHPLYSNGPKGGHFTPREHLFPLTQCQENLWIPLPILGTVYAFLRKNIANPQELAHPKYQNLKFKLRGWMGNYANFIFVSGHEHSLQLFEDENQDFVVSGAGSKRNPVALGDDATFVAGVRGYSVLNTYTDGEVWIEFWAVSEEDGNELFEPKSIFRKKIKPPLESIIKPVNTKYPEYEKLKTQDSIMVSVMDTGDITIFNPSIWGHLHTEMYMTDFKIPVLDLATAKGGLTPFELGGGKQTNSLRLTNEAGKIYQLRSVRKVTDRLPTLLQKTYGVEIVEQQLTAGYPFSPMIVSPMEKAIGINYRQPSIVYVPKQPNLGKYNDLGGAVYLFEERADGDWSDLESFGYPDDIEKIRKVINKELKNDKTVIDQSAVLRCRLFDMIIGDWDRHDNQWRWAEHKKKDGKKVYVPIPRDRDQAFARYDGLINRIADYTFPMIRGRHNYDGDISKRETTWLNHTPRLFDRFFLTEMTLQDWEKQAKFIQENLTDEVIENAVQNLPPFAYQKDGLNFIKWIKLRRDDILTVARNYYEILNKTVSITGTHKDNLFVIHRLNNFQTKVTVFEYKKDKTTQQFLYERTFENAVTKELCLYGLDGDDQFQVNGQVQKSPLVRLIGGKGNDLFRDNSRVKGMSKKTHIYDDKKENTVLRFGTETRDKRSKIEELNTFNYRDFVYNYSIPFPSIGTNPDDGLYFKLNVSYWTTRFKSKQIHRFNGGVALGSNAYNLGYNGDYLNAFNHWDLNLRAVAEVPRFVSNFHGLGNETTRDIEKYGRDYYRIQRTLYGVYPSFKRSFESGVNFLIGPALESIKIEDKSERITAEDFMAIRPLVFNQQHFTGGNIALNFFNSDNGALPTQGLGLSLAANWRMNLKNTDRQLLQLQSGLSFYTRLLKSDHLVLENSIFASHIFGKYDFFQSINIGGGSSLRGFAKERFSGQSAFYHSMNLRIKVIDSENKFLPFSAGISPGFDYGRVWLKGETSDSWHTSYGGSIWFAPLDMIALSGGLFFSEEGSRFAVSFSFQFYK